MQFTLTINCENDAFLNNTSRELARILRLVAEHVPDNPDEGKLRDYNGHTVGHWELTADGPGPYIIIEQGDEVYMTIGMSGVDWPSDKILSAWQTQDEADRALLRELNLRGE